MIYTLKPMVGELLPAIVVYATVISLMLLTAINRFSVAQKQSAQFVFWGALLFVLSDTLLAINKFHTPFNGAGVAVMATYGAAQYLLVRGFNKIVPKN
jgi:uncharacterized membrane protein YhhN